MIEGTHVFETLEPIQYVVEAWPVSSETDGRSYYVEFIARACWLEASPVRGRVSYERAGASSSMERTENPAEAHWHVRGSVKWDGCCNCEYNNEVMVHICGPAGIDEQAELLRGIYRLARRLMGDTVMFDVDAPPP